MATATLKRTFANGHAYHINSLSFNADGETYLSADDLRIHIWNLNTAQQAYNIADLKPADMEELSEVIMAAEFHPTDCAALAYCSSKGVLRLADLRERALCDTRGGCRTFRPQADAEASSFFSEVVSSMTDVKFSRDGRRLMTQYGAKPLAMQVLKHPDPTVQKYALTCVQRLMVINWEYLGSK